ncbi:hypothetical protein VNPA120661_35280 [Pseudomonas aeruginosa]|nr:hypothetical protein VNPA120661_35280 [Pseudomonas aeruginosa]GLF39793.1 hypothetical protein VNPA141709_25460 [Pseudomonas aeruginosa]GLF72686.1 hypothetical protein VNPA152080_41090 [Pseudomonas aeruginosa]
MKLSAWVGRAQKAASNSVETKARVRGIGFSTRRASKPSMLAEERGGGKPARVANVFTCGTLSRPAFLLLPRAQA